MSLSGHIAPSPPAHSTWFRLEQRRIRDRRAPKKVSCCARRVRMRENERVLDGFWRLDPAQNRTTSECPLFAVTAVCRFLRALLSRVKP